jgi:sulfide:quinone oxidoreductase
VHAELDGAEPTARFPHEFVCIVDALDAGTLVYRDERQTFSMPDSPPMHEAKCTAEHAFLQRLSS